jgi:cytochrome c biogenesis protein CcdA/thiol-disulfide isomerase/thioredoxin
LPILPVIFVGWTAPVVDEEHPLRARRRRAVAVVLGLVVSFGVITALGSVILSSLGLPQNFLRDLGIALLVLFGVGLLIPNVEHLLERPFARLTRAAPTGNKSGFVFGLGLGLVFVPCAGPVLSAVSTLGARHHASLFSVLLSFFFAVGAAIPLFAIALAGDRVIERNRNLSRTARRYRPVAGALLIVMALAIGFNAVSALQRWLPTYTQSLQHLIERNSYVTHQLHSLEYANSGNGSLSACVSAASQTTVNGLQSCGIAPEFTGITNWLNTPGDRPLTLAGLRGHVVLVDFWTYSCINCQRTLPHVEAWYAKYHRYGFDVIGVEAPEFAFEHLLSNIAGAAGSLGVRYPIAVDDNLGTWTAYQNNYTWPTARATTR